MDDFLSDGGRYVGRKDSTAGGPSNMKRCREVSPSSSSSSGSSSASSSPVRCIPIPHYERLGVQNSSHNKLGNMYVACRLCRVCSATAYVLFLSSFFIYFLLLFPSFFSFFLLSLFFSLSFFPFHLPLCLPPLFPPFTFPSFLPLHYPSIHTFSTPRTV